MINIMVTEKMDGARWPMAWPWDDEDDSGMLWRENLCVPKTYFSFFFNSQYFILLTNACNVCMMY